MGTVEYEVREYECGYCDYGKFEEATRMSSGDKHSHGRNMVRCPKCKNFLKVMEGRLVRTENANSRFG